MTITDEVRPHLCNTPLSLSRPNDTFRYTSGNKAEGDRRFMIVQRDLNAWKQIQVCQNIDEDDLWSLSTNELKIGSIGSDVQLTTHTVDSFAIGLGVTSRYVSM